MAIRISQLRVSPVPLSPTDQIVVDVGNPPTTYRVPLLALTTFLGQTINPQAGAAYTFGLTDSYGVIVSFTSAGAAVATIPVNLSVPFPIGTRLNLLRYGAGTVSVAAGAGVTIRKAFAVLTLRAQYSRAYVEKIAIDEWLLSGDIG